MIGLYFTMVTHAAEQIDRAREQATRLAGVVPRDYFVASPASNDPTFCSGKEASILAPVAKGSLDGAMFVVPVRSFRDAYSAAMLRHVYNAVKRESWLLVPYYEAAVAEKTGFWNIEWLRNQLGIEDKLFPTENYALFKRGDELPQVDSVLSALLADPVGYTRAFLSERVGATTPNFLESCNDFLVKPAYAMNVGIQQAIDDMPDLNDDLEAFFRYVTYSVTGVSYKTNALRRFVAKYLNKRSGLRTIDIGGGIGLVDIELLLTTPTIAEATVCEPVASTLPLTKLLYNTFRRQLQGRYRHALACAQDYAFDDPVDLVADFASLLYVPRVDLKRTLDRAWKALNPGGILVIHENIKRELFKSKNYYDKVFTAEELEDYLKPFGRIDYFRSSDLLPMNKSDTKDLTVFRVIRKRG